MTPYTATAARRPAIVTLTMNPALDVTASTARVHPSSKVRCYNDRYDPGGGGINAARIAHLLGADVLALFPIGGQTGELLVDLLIREGVPYRRVEIPGRTRESFTVDEESTGEQYRFVLPGPTLSSVEYTRCLDELRAVATGARFVIASGSLPPAAPVGFYQAVAELCAGLGARLILDASGPGLRHLTSGVFLLKPSLRELGELVGRELDAEPDILAAARELITAGTVEVVVVSRGPQGALLVTADEWRRFPAIARRPVSTVGAGDAMVGAIATALSRDWSLPDAVRYGIAASAAKLGTVGTELCRREDVERHFAQTLEG
ncbi:1-phosphofructokinase family hexose kinase [Mycolicibacillus parakoreensis]|uniref:1-phosphofructokinase family hexose kinase n=1 Tax=Mycolicibacillus parakoreensis TaxID=1069221 RepID=A0ABY3TWW7_9MYCO|nr:1-phosphofructokinase family hexose kinase [Mycolicibacillus parakoreensis]MCV7316168.1 1-phosphofructokinase family hexose kinase [Mycolicibacillus parakoreensis]ULN52218.1 1-phosphofructokinase family hexose kinase [Mycolicibacillus parakoreensis]HLR98610.1 1-phosphofructokinase family hexose kinase [Mycolicibacillus parakoreensis]